MSSEVMISAFAAGQWYLFCLEETSVKIRAGGSIGDVWEFYIYLLIVLIPFDKGVSMLNVWS